MYITILSFLKKEHVDLVIVQWIQWVTWTRVIVYCNKPP